MASPVAPSASVPAGYKPNPANAWGELSAELGGVPKGELLEMEAKPWWTSKTIIGALMVIVAQVLERAGIQISADDPALTETVAALVSIVGGVLAIYGRTRANRPVSAGASGGSLGLVVWGIGALGVLLMSGGTTGAGGLQGEISVGYGDAFVRYRSDGRVVTVEAPVVLELPKKEGLSK